MIWHAEGTLPANSEAIGEMFIPSYALSRRIITGLGTRVGSTLLFSTTARFCNINCSFLSSRSIQTTIRSSGVSVLMTFIVGVKSYSICKFVAKLPIMAILQG